VGGGRQRGHYKRHSARKAALAFEQQPVPGRLILDGSLDGHAIHIDARLFDRESLLLASRSKQFNWIQERPFNRWRSAE
jgi:hypothetical protein